MQKQKLEKIIGKYTSFGFSLERSGIENAIYCPSGRIYNRAVLFESCPICAQDEEDEEPASHMHDNAVLKEALRAKRFYFLNSQLESMKLGEAGFKF